ncbi:uncharacterized protein LOC119331814 [Triticum dicoccoides]|uniref:uncharacterized protein LOC119331814 n=1 Tax=Triticum dicoccoides TaxID=85692 RepID=UPI001891799E|nr:uncharacterized protein LOC119331814 [Triticum dicoccoides]
MAATEPLEHLLLPPVASPLQQPGRQIVAGAINNAPSPVASSAPAVLVHALETASEDLAASLVSSECRPFAFSTAVEPPKSQDAMVGLLCSIPIAPPSSSVVFCSVPGQSAVLENRAPSGRPLLRLGPRWFPTSPPHALKTAPACTFATSRSRCASVREEDNVVDARVDCASPASGCHLGSKA